LRETARIVHLIVVSQVKTVGKTDGVFLIGGKLFVKEVSGEILLFVSILMVTGQWSDHVVFTPTQRVLHVVGRKLPTIGILTVVKGVIVVHPWSGEAGGRTIAVSVVIDDKHVVDEVLDIQKVLKARVTGLAIDIKTLGLEIIIVVRPSINGSLPKAVISLDIPSRGVNLLGIVLVNGVVVVLIAAKVGFSEGTADTFLCHIDSPINSVKVKMIVATSCIGVPHGGLGIAAPDLTDHGIVRGSAEGP
jgi:hypothetical protein